MHVAITKPDFGITGGFERVLGHIADDLEARGHRVSWLLAPAAQRLPNPFGCVVPDDVARLAPEFVRYFGLAETFLGIDASRADVLVSTQPPSFVVDHPRHLSLFYHHTRAFYDLAEVSMAAGLVEHDCHVEALDRVRRFDRVFLDRVGWFLAGSASVAERLAAFNGLSSNVSVFHAGLGVDVVVGADDHGPRPDGHALCVSRHEFPKRTELFVQAMALVGGRPTGVAVGAGGRLGWAKQLVHEYHSGQRDPDGDSSSVWLCAPGYVPPESVPDASGAVVELRGAVDDVTLSKLYAGALCVVAPAYAEDYGLTAIEAMAHGKPVIVCEDGGGLTELVEDGVTGLVVEATGRSIADAVVRLRDDPELASALGVRAKEEAAAYTWSRALREFHHGLEQVLS